jgi:Fe-S cluster biogenesis protein NfuA
MGEYTEACFDNVPAVVELKGTSMADTADSAGTSVRARVQEFIDTIRPAIQSDGGDVELVNVDEQGLVQVRLKGACCGCPSANMTLKMGIERHLKMRVPEVSEVVCV